MTNKSYTDQFIEAMGFYIALHQNEEITGASLKDARKHFHECSELKTEFKKVSMLMEKAASELLSRGESLGVSANRSSHARSDDFFRFWQETKWGEDFHLMVTIGNIYYKGKNIYDTSVDKIRDILAAGVEPGRELNLHVWLTLEDMTVLDLTVLTTMAAKGFDTSGYSESEVLIWRDGQPSDFVYEPLLVDNNFYEKVDR